MKRTKLKIDAKVVVTTNYTATVTAADITRALGLPAGAQLWFNVPGGGDWSNEQLDVNEYPLTAEWTTEDVKAE